MAHAPRSDASPDDREDFYTTFSEALSDRNEMDTKVVLMDANTGPGEWRKGRSHFIRPHEIPYAKKDLDKDPNHFQFNYFCWNHNLCVGHTWFKHKESQKLTFYPNSPHSGQPRDMDHILIDGRSSSCLEDVRSLPELPISTHEKLVDGTQPGHRMVIAKLHCRLRKPEPKIKTQTYLRSLCMEPDTQSAIQKELKEPAHINRLAHLALDKGGAFGIDTSYHWSRRDPPFVS